LTPSLNRRALLFGSAGVGASLVLAACSSSDDKKKTPALNKGALEKVAYVSGLGATGRESHAWVAQAKGFFKEQGLDVDVQQGQAGDSNNQLLKADKVQYASVDSSGAFVRWGTGKDQTWVAFSATTQLQMTSIITLEGKGITQPKDLEGKKIGGATGAAPQTLFPGYAKLAGIDNTKVTFVPMQSSAIISALAAGTVDAVALFAPAAPSVEAVTKKKTITLPYTEYMSDPFGVFVITSKKNAEAKPDQVKRFNAALQKGLLYTFDHPDEAGDIIHKAVPATAAPGAAAEIKLERSYAIPRDGDSRLGTISLTRAAKTVALLQSLNLIPKAFDPKNMIRTDLYGDVPNMTA
jgi:NitT/TauT family transport system substrate-binding protein